MARSLIAQRDVIVSALTEHAVITLPGIGKQRAACRCGWTDTSTSKTGIMEAAATHQAGAILEAQRADEDERKSAAAYQDYTEGYPDA